MTPLRNLSDVITVQRESLAIKALAVANIVINRLREVCVACREVTCIFDKGGFSNDHDAFACTECIDLGCLLAAWLRAFMRFGVIRLLFQSLKLILRSNHGSILVLIAGTARGTRLVIWKHCVAIGINALGRGSRQQHVVVGCAIWVDRWVVGHGSSYIGATVALEGRAVRDLVESMEN